MTPPRNHLIGILFLSIISISTSQSLPTASPANNLLLLPSIRKLRHFDSFYCQSWRFSVETNDAGKWSTIPGGCLKFVTQYMTGQAYASDCDIVAVNSIEFAISFQVAGDGKDAWVFDVDDTLLSNLPYYQARGFGSEMFDEDSFNAWVRQAEAPALSASLSLYNELQQLGFKIFLLTGRTEPFRNSTVENLQLAGYDNWERLILRGSSDKGKLAINFKSEKRKELEDEGYRIRGNSGDQWSDLLGYAISQRSFKHPNPMYYIP